MEMHRSHASRTRSLAFPSLISLAIALAAAATLPAFSSSHNDEAIPADPAQWSSDDVYQILHNSPWTKTVKITLSSGNSGLLGNQTGGGNSNGNWGNNGQMPGSMGGMGRRSGMGGGRSSGTYSSGGSKPESAPKSGPTEVTVQWQSALVVRLAAAKKAGETADPASFKPLDEYIVAVIGLPATALGGRAASADSDSTIDQEQEQRMQERVKSSASILRSGHEALTPTKVEFDQGADGRTLIHFGKTDPISPSEKSVEFRLALGRSELRRKFTLKDMEYQGKLEL